MNKKALKWLQSQKWILPAGLLNLALMSTALIALCFANGFDRLERGWIFNIGMDLLGILVCGALFYGCMTGKDNREETTYLFLTLLYLNGYTLFLDGCVWLVQGIPSLRVLNLLLNVLFFQQGPIIT